MKIININKATEEELMLIKGIGKVRAAAIQKARPFRDIYELSKVAGLGQKRMDKIIAQDLLITIK